MEASLARRHTGNLPADVTSFIGRRSELADVRQKLQRARLVTLTGVGGVGKTRLALRAAADMQRAFPDGVWLVELAELSEPRLVTEAVLAALGLHEEPNGWPAYDVLAEHCAQRRLLLVLDNCEHVLHACAMLANALLKSSNELKILATSRQPLRIDGEHRLDLDPLPIPEEQTPATPASLASNEAIRLLVERASAIDPAFHVNEANAAALGAICRRLDGIPLAIELAAGRLRALSPQQLLTRLDSSYDLLVGGSRAAPPRQQTMRALIDWSYELCTPAEQLLWAKLSVFRGGFRLDAAERICTDDRIAASVVLDVLEGLIDKSIISIDRRDTELRYRLSETLREYGIERLRELGELDALRRSARDWCEELVTTMAAQWFGPDQADFLATIRREHGNIAAALNQCLADPAGASSGLTMAALLRPYWMTGERISEGRHWLDRLLAQFTDPSTHRIRALCICALLTNGSSAGITAVDAMLDEADSLAKRLDDPSGGAYVAQQRGISLLFRTEANGSIELLDKALTGHRQLSDVGEIAYDLALLATAKIAASRRDVSADLEECVALCNAAGESWVRAFALWVLGVEQCKEGALEEAEASQIESLRLRIPLGVPYLMALNLDALGWVAAERDDAPRAARLFGAADGVMRQVGGTLVARGPTGPLHEEYVSRARRTLGVPRFDEAYQAGLAMTIEDATAIATGSRLAKVRTVAAEARHPDTQGLTSRELEVAQLIARGLTNKQIAAALVISQRTAEGHVEHVLTKLGYTSRAQVATWVTSSKGEMKPSRY
jgi:predicted ATPase/DNA-binding CsgD family transcriptional regulator